MENLTSENIFGAIGTRELSGSSGSSGSRTFKNVNKKSRGDDFNESINDRGNIDKAIYSLKKKYPDKKEFGFDLIINEIGKMHNKEALKSSEKPVLIKEE